MKNQIVKIVGGIVAGVVVSVISNEIAKRQYGRPLVDRNRLKSVGDEVSSKVGDLTTKMKSLAA